MNRPEVVRKEVEPQTLRASAWAISRARMVGFDGPALRAMCEMDCRFEFKLMSRVAHLLGSRLRDTRMELINLAVQPD